MSRRAGIRKRERQKCRHAQRPKQVDKPISHVKTAGLIGDLITRSTSRAFDEALREVQHTEVQASSQGEDCESGSPEAIHLLAPVGARRLQP